MKKTIEEYMALPYTTEIVPDEDGFFVKIKELEGCFSVGSTKAEALDMIEDAMKSWFEVALEDGMEVPLPQVEQRASFSGKFALRMPKTLHANLARAAIDESVSLNQYIVSLLAERYSQDIYNKRLVSTLSDIITAKTPEVETNVSVVSENRGTRQIPQRNFEVIIGGR